MALAVPEVVYLTGHSATEHREAPRGLVETTLPRAAAPQAPSPNGSCCCPSPHPCRGWRLIFAPAQLAEVILRR